MMKTGTATAPQVLTINAGSSSLKFALYELAGAARRQFSGTVQRVGQPGATITTREPNTPPVERPLAVGTKQAAIDAMLQAVTPRLEKDAFRGVAHRVTHGGPKFFAPQVVSADLLAELRRLEPFDPEHLPAQIELIDELTQSLPHIPQLACFDTAFHEHLPVVARRLPLPRRFDPLGIRRYGFHGLSFAFLMEKFNRINPQLANGRVILAHLGNGCSLAAVLNGRCIDTTMSFTPTGGIPMGTRSGDLDPSIASYLAHSAGISLDEFQSIANRESGMKGISETSSDMRDLLARAGTDSRAQEAIDIFCYCIKKTIGAYAAALGGLDALIFSGGIGERAPAIRANICSGLEFLRLTIDGPQNEANAQLISQPGSTTSAFVIATDEEQMLARSAFEVLK